MFTLQGLPHFGSKDDREGAHRNKKLGVFCRRPVLLCVPSAGADQQMNMRMVKQSASPGMEYREDGGRSAQIAWIGGQFLGGRGGATKQQAINDLGMLIGQRPQGRRQSEGQQIMRTRQQARLLFLQPGGGLLAMAFGAMPVTAGMIGIAESRTGNTHRRTG